jgi:hypothetical protein
MAEWVGQEQELQVELDGHPVPLDDREGLEDEKWAEVRVISLPLLGGTPCSKQLCTERLGVSFKCRIVILTWQHVKRMPEVVVPRLLSISACGSDTGRNLNL